jgi:MipA family protein
MQKPLFSLLAVSALTVSAAAHPAFAAAADTECQGPSEECVAVGHWNFSVALGAGIRTNPLVNGRDLPIVAVPHVSYYGSHFFIEDLDAGFTLADTGATSISLIASPGYDRAFFYRSDLQNIFVTGVSGDDASNTSRSAPFPARTRHVTYLAGPEWTFRYRWVEGQLDVLHDLTDQDHGTEVRAAMAMPILESTSLGKFTANAGVTWKSASIVNYYYGAPGFYQAGAALDPFLKLSYSRRLSSRWRLNALIQYERLGSAIADSPIVARDYVVTAFVGAIYPFW